MLKKATAADLPAVAALACRLWPDNTIADMLDDLALFPESEDAAIFLIHEGSAAVGFAQCSLRHDYVEGTQSSPVGYLEGIYVDEAHRRLGYARLLLSACEIWAREQGCTEFASDCELHNTQSLQFHLKTGFEEANRIICFTKPL